MLRSICRSILPPGRLTGFYYGIGVFFCIFAAAIILYHIVQFLRGRMTEEELIEIRESEDEAMVAMEEEALTQPAASSPSATAARR